MLYAIFYFLDDFSMKLPVPHFWKGSLFHMLIPLLLLCLSACGSTKQVNGIHKITQDHQVVCHESKAHRSQQTVQGDSPPGYIINTATSQRLTLKQIMANPDWIGLTKHATWSFDSHSVLYQQVPYDQSVFELQRYDIKAANS